MNSSKVQRTTPNNTTVSFPGPERAEGDFSHLCQICVYATMQCTQTNQEGRCCCLLGTIPAVKTRCASSSQKLGEDTVCHNPVRPLFTKALPAGNAVRNDVQLLVFLPGQGMQGHSSQGTALRFAFTNQFKRRGKTGVYKRFRGRTGQKSVKFGIWNTHLISYKCLPARPACFK